MLILIKVIVSSIFIISLQPNNIDFHFIIIFYLFLLLLFLFSSFFFFFTKHTLILTKIFLLRKISLGSFQ